MNGRIEELEARVDGFVGAGGTLEIYDSLLTVAADYLVNQDNMATAAELESIAQVTLAAGLLHRLIRHQHQLYFLHITKGLGVVPVDV